MMTKKDERKVNKFSETKTKTTVTTVIRLKRRRDDPVPPDRFQFKPTTNHNFSSRKRARRYENDVNHILSHLSLSSSQPQSKTDEHNDPNDSINSSPTVTFKRTTADSVQNQNKRKKEAGSTIIHVVDTQLDESNNLPLQKRAKISLKMMETRTIDADELWKLQSSTKSKDSCNPTISENVESKKPTSSLRDRMRRKATQQNQKKTSIDTSGTKSKKLGNRKVTTTILDPLTRMVDESLIQISLNGSEKIMSHFDLLQNHRHNLNDKEYKRLINWTCSNGAGSILHLAAMFHQVDAVKLACNILQIDTKLLDGENRTSLQIAKLMKTEAYAANNTIISILSQYEQPSTMTTSHNEVREKEEDYVYDLYYMETKNNESDTDSCSKQSKDETKYESLPGLTTKEYVPSSNRNMHHDDNSNENTACRTGTRSLVDQTTIEISGGIGYWNELGELVMETDPMTFDTELDDRGQSHGNVENDIDDDSNDEDFYTNDYPDEDNEEKESAYYNNTYNPGYYYDMDADQNPVFLTTAMNNYNETSNNNYSISNYGRVARSDDSDDDEIIRRHCNDFRNCPVDWGQDGNNGFLTSSSVTTNESTINFWNNEAQHSNGFNSNLVNNHNRRSNLESNDDNDSDNYGYRGLMYGEQRPSSWSNERIYGSDINNFAYDSDLDD